jgi:hypothetical protein
MIQKEALRKESVGGAMGRIQLLSTPLEGEQKKRKEMHKVYDDPIVQHPKKKCVQLEESQQ